jgi:opacity protein-like surface antigen
MTPTPCTSLPKARARRIEPVAVDLSGCRRHVAAALLLAASAVAPGIVQAQASSPGWAVSATLYGYFPSVGGETAFPVKSGGGTVDISVDQILDSIDFVFMGTLDVHNGRWGAFTDLMYLDLGGSKSNSRDFTIGGKPIPGGTTADLGWDMKGVIWTLAGQYRMVGGSGLTLDALAGARLADIEQDASWVISGSLGPLAPPARTGTGEAEISHWDGVVGLKGRYTIAQAPKWSLPFYIDVGAGDSDLTWQVVAGVSYAFGWGELSAGWRYLDYDLKDGSPIKDLNFNGAMIGATFRW